MATTFDILKVGDRFRFLNHAAPKGIMEKTSSSGYRDTGSEDCPKTVRTYGLGEFAVVEWIDPAKPAPEPKTPRYTVGPYREIRRDGIPWVSIVRAEPRGGEPISDEGAYLAAMRIADLLNQHGEG